MKKVIENKNDSVVEISGMDRKKCYGVQVGLARGFITQVNFKDEEGDLFVVRCMDGITEGLMWADIGDSLSDLAQHLISNGREIFEFDKPEDLCKWLSEQYL